VRQSDTYLTLHHARKQELAEEKEELVTPSPLSSFLNLRAATVSAAFAEQHSKTT
jgi:hypothetical protein